MGIRQSPGCTCCGPEAACAIWVCVSGCNAPLGDYSWEVRDTGGGLISSGAVVGTPSNGCYSITVPADGTYDITITPPSPYTPAQTQRLTVDCVPTPHVYFLQYTFVLIDESCACQECFDIVFPTCIALSTPCGTVNLNLAAGGTIFDGGYYRGCQLCTTSGWDRCLDAMGAAQYDASIDVPVAYQLSITRNAAGCVDATFTMWWPVGCGTEPQTYVAGCDFHPGYTPCLQVTGIGYVPDRIDMLICPEYFDLTGNIACATLNSILFSALIPSDLCPDSADEKEWTLQSVNMAIGFDCAAADPFSLSIDLEGAFGPFGVCFYARDLNVPCVHSGYNPVTKIFGENPVFTTSTPC